MENLLYYPYNTSLPAFNKLKYGLKLLLNAVVSFLFTALTINLHQVIYFCRLLNKGVIKKQNHPIIGMTDRKYSMFYPGKLLYFFPDSSGYKPAPAFKT